jgi:dephospho-CoA kinase
MPLIIGLTGGIGSGKSEASKRFAARGIAVVDADIVAREVVVQGTPALTEITDRFGSGILDGSGNLNRGKLRAIIFADPAEKHWLEALLHPIINAEIRRQLANATSSYAILASPLLLETQQYQLVDRILVIDTSEQLQLERASQRDKNNEAQIKAIMQTQLARQERCARATEIIENHGSIDALENQVEQLHRRYLALVQSSAESHTHTN